MMGLLWKVRFEWQADVIFCQSSGGCARGSDVVELSRLSLLIEGVGFGELVQQRSHPPGESLHLLDSSQAGGCVRCEWLGAVLADGG